MKKTFLIGVILMLSIGALHVTHTWAFSIFGGPATGAKEGLGSFGAELVYSFTSETAATLTVDLMNTSPVNNGGFITAFALNNPSDFITHVRLICTDKDFQLIGGYSFENSIRASPFGIFDIGASISNRWLGGKKPGFGIGVGDAERFTFSLEGSRLSTLSEQDFLDELSVSSNRPNFFAVRFRGFKDGGGDKVPGHFISPAPIPDAVFLLASGFFGLIEIRRKFRKT